MGHYRSEMCCDVCGEGVCIRNIRSKIAKHNFDTSEYVVLKGKDPKKYAGYMEALTDVQNYLQTIDTEFLTAEKVRLMVSKYVRYKEYN